jgi:hypothetical protein
MYTVSCRRTFFIPNMPEKFFLPECKQTQYKKYSCYNITVLKVYFNLRLQQLLPLLLDCYYCYNYIGIFAAIHILQATNVKLKLNADNIQVLTRV